MALATAKAAPLRSDIKLSQALSDYEAILSAEQKQSYKTSPPDANAVMTFTCEIDRQNAGRRTRRCAARLTSFLNSVKGFTSIVDLLVSSSGNPIAGGVWAAVKLAIQVNSSPTHPCHAVSRVAHNPAYLFIEPFTFLTQVAIDCDPLRSVF